MSSAVTGLVRRRAPAPISGRDATADTPAMVDAPETTPPVDEATGDADLGRTPRRWPRRLLVVVTGLSVIGLAGAAHRVQIHAIEVEQQRADAEVSALGASVLSEQTGVVVSDRALDLTAVESGANDAAIEARAARSRLADTGVTEADLNATLDAERQEVEAANQKRDGLDAEVRARIALIPDTDRCLADALRSLSLLARSPRLPLIASDSCARPETGAG